MIDRAALARQAEMSSDQTEAAMVNALKALALLEDPEMLPLLDALAKKDPNLRVRDAARKAAEATRGKAAKRLERRAAVLVG